MKQAHITYSGMDLDYRKANVLATTFANNDADIAEPVMVAWNDLKASRMSPVVKGESLDSGWHQYGESHGGKLEVDVNGEYDFIFADSSQFDPYGPSPYINLRDQHGNEYLCQINALRDPHNPTKEACVPLDEWTSKMT
jgi:hypothetical protein